VSFSDAPPPKRPTPPAEGGLPRGARWHGPPQDELGAPVPVRIVFVRTEHLAVAVIGATAYANGLDFTLTIRCRAPGEPIDGTRELIRSPLEPLFSRHQRSGLEAEIRLDVEFADGRKATNADRPVPPEEPLDPPVLSLVREHGSKTDWHAKFWLSPIPPPGEMAFVLDWPSANIHHARHTIDANMIIEASKQTEILWSNRGLAETQSSDDVTGYARSCGGATPPRA
jgi:hypothetical protein